MRSLALWPNLSPFRCIIIIKTVMNWEIRRMDVKAAFLNEVLEMKIYMDQLEGFVQDGKKCLVCKLKKKLYMLKQLLRVWYHRIGSLFINKGF